MMRKTCAGTMRGFARRWGPAAGAVGLCLVAIAMLGGPRPAGALRANLRSDLDRLAQLGRYEEALFFRRCTRDMILAVHCAWSGAPYDPRMDGLFFETRTDRRYWNMVNGQKRPISELLAKAKLTPAQLDLLDLRVRVYVEDHMSPDFDEMGNGNYEASHAQPAGGVACLDAADGRILWTTDLAPLPSVKSGRGEGVRVGDTVLTTVALADGAAFFGSRDGRLYCLDAATGRPALRRVAELLLLLPRRAVGYGRGPETSNRAGLRAGRAWTDGTSSRR